MTKLCILGFDDHKVIKDFIRLHVEKLAGEKVCLHGAYPDYRESGRLIRYFYSRQPLRMKLARLLPEFAHHRLIAKKAHSSKRTVDAVGGFCDKHHVDVILAEFGNNGATFAPIAKELGIPLVVHFHGHDAHRQPLLTDARRKKYRDMFNYAHGVLGVSQHMMSALRELGCPDDKLTYNPYGPRESFYDNASDYSPVVLSVGRFTDIKANYLVVMAFSKALQEAPQAKLIMVGDGELLEACKTLARVLGIDRQVTFTGAIPHSEVKAYFRNACCFAQHSVMPSYGDAEGTPNTILEAGAAALPVVSTRHAGIKDVVVENETGLLVDEFDVEGMAQQMATLLNNPERCRSMGDAARKYIQENFSSDMHAQRLQAVIDSARKQDK